MKSSSKLSKPKGKKANAASETKVCRSFSIESSDRISLCDKALELVSALNGKLILPMFATPGYPSTPEALSPKEQQAYDAALNYLERQFKEGFKETEVFETSISNSPAQKIEWKL